jgi:lipopolysaccharide export system permease protein
MSRLVRYALRTVAWPTTAWLGFLCALFYLVGFLRGIDVMLGSAVGLFDVFGIFALLTPQYLVQITPLAVVLGTVQGLGRLADDGEMTAVQTAGLNPVQLALAPALIGVAATLMLAVIAQTAQPMGVRAVRHRVFEVIERNAVGDVRPGQFYEGLEGLTVHVESIDGGQWHHVMLHDSRAVSPVLLLAQSARPNRSTGMGLSFELHDGALHADDGALATLVTHFASGTVRADLGSARGAAGAFRFAREEASLTELAAEADRLKQANEEARPIQLTLHERVRQVVVPLGLALIAAAVTLRRRTAGGTASAVALSTALSVAYHLLARTAQSAGERGTLEPWVAGGLPNAVAIGLGTLGLWHVSRRGT